MSAGQAKPESRPETNRVFHNSDRVRVTILKVIGSQITIVTLLIELI